MQPIQHTPIFSMDVQGFTTHDHATQRTIIRRLQEMATEAARFFMPYGDPWAKWRRHGAGDGYYVVLDGLSPQVALHYAVQLDAHLAEHNARHGDDVPLRLYGVLVLGDVELVGDQYLSAAFSEAARFLSYEPLKAYLKQHERPMVLAMSALFHSEWQADLARRNDFPASASLQWTAFRFHDKHQGLHRGYVRGPGWMETKDIMSIQYTGKHKLDVCDRLLTDWRRLADVLDIPLADRAIFAPGREPHHIWEWLEVRERLAALAPALESIGRQDLAERLPRPS